MTDEISFKIKTYNPFQLFFILIASVVLSLWLLNSYDSKTTILLGSLISILALTLANYFLGSDIEVQLTKKGLETNWAILPFFNKTHQEVLWTDIVSWNFESWRMADTFYLKTSEGQKLYLRCFNLFKRQEHLNDFIQAFQEYYSKYKHAGFETTDNNIPFMAKRIGRVFAFAYFIIVTIGTYIVFVKNKTPLTSARGLKVIFIFAVLLSFVIAAIYFYFFNKNEPGTKRYS
jgi:hypothetical protein